MTRPGAILGWGPISILNLCLVAASLQAAGIPEAAIQSQPQQLALVVGNGVYAGAPLKNPVNDAQAMS